MNPLTTVSYGDSFLLGFFPLVEKSIIFIFLTLPTLPKTNPYFINSQILKLSEKNGGGALRSCNFSSVSYFSESSTPVSTASCLLLLQIHPVPADWQPLLESPLAINGSKETKKKE